MGVANSPLFCSHPCLTIVGVAAGGEVDTTAAAAAAAEEPPAAAEAVAAAEATLAVAMAGLTKSPLLLLLLRCLCAFSRPLLSLPGAPAVPVPAGWKCLPVRIEQHFDRVVDLVALSRLFAVFFSFHRFLRSSEFVNRVARCR